MPLKRNFNEPVRCPKANGLCLVVHQVFVVGLKDCNLVTNLLCQPATHKHMCSSKANLGSTGALVGSVQIHLLQFLLAGRTYFKMLWIVYVYSAATVVSFCSSALEIFLPTPSIKLGSNPQNKKSIYQLKCIWFPMTIYASKIPKGSWFA